MHFNSDHYELLEKIGQGGFGEVYKARQLNTNQLVAIKFLTFRPEFNEATKQRYVDRFERETLLGSKLQHPNIVRLLDKGQTSEGLLFAVFEYINGKTLRELLSSAGALSPIKTAEIMAQVLDALVHAHQQGVIHRDIKPANIMLTHAGVKTHAMVLDFGIGALINDVRQLDYRSLTLTKETLGTPSYSAPEQLRGEPPTPKTDLYVWGLLFIECLIGKPAISGSNLASIFHQQLSPSNVPIPPAIVGHPIAGLLRRVLNKKASERIDTAAAVYRELMHINFSTLVGDISGKSTQDSKQGELDDTLQTTGTYLSRLTERKQITVLSVLLNIRSNDELAPQHELIDTLLADQKNQCQDTAIRYGAFHVGTLGDSLLFYFGYPTVSENDARLCARTALDIMSNLNRRNALLKEAQGIEFSICIGIHSGLVTCYSDAIPEGITPNATLGLARMAAANQVLCSDSTRKLLDTYIEFEPQKVLQKNEATRKEVRPFLLIGERKLEAFGFLRGTQKKHAFVGRDLEFATLVQLINSKVGNRQRLVHIQGEAGIGKSRLIFELRNATRTLSHYVAQCLPEHKNNALYPILNILKYQYSLDALDTKDVFERLRQAINQLRLSAPADNTESADNNQRLAILCTWLNLPLLENLATSTLPPEQQKHILFSTLNALLTHKQSNTTHVSNDFHDNNENQLNHSLKNNSLENNNLQNHTQQKLFIFEDMHWADPTSLEFIAQFSQSSTLAEAEDIFISTSRQPLPGNLMEMGFTSIHLTKLTPADTSALITALFDNAKVAPKVQDVIIARTDGIPLFIEELVNMLKQKKLVHTVKDNIDFISPDKLQEVPNSLRDSLQQKFDSLIYAKATAQLAATIGREFDYNLLVAASNLSESQTQNNLSELIAAELIYQQRKVSGDSYIFKHALVRDVIKDGIPKELLKHYSNSVAVQLSALPKTLANLSVLSQHHINAENYDKIISTGIELVEMRLKLGDYESARVNIEQCWAAAAHIDDKLSAITTKLKLNSFTITILGATEGYGSDSLLSTIESNNALYAEYVSSTNGTIERNLAEYLHHASWASMTHMHMKSFRHEALKSALTELSFCLKFYTDPDALLTVYTQIANCLLLDGKPKEAANYLTKAFTIFSHEPNKPIADESILKYGFSAKAFPYMISSIVELLRGNKALGKKHSRYSIEISDEVASPLTKAISIGYGAIFSWLAKDIDYLTELLALMEQHLNENPSVQHFSLYTDIAKAWQQNNAAQLKLYIDLVKQSQQTQWLSVYLSMLMEVEIALENHTAADALLAELRQWTSETGERVCINYIESLNNTFLCEPTNG